LKALDPIGNVQELRGKRGWVTHGGLILVVPVLGVAPRIVALERFNIK